MFLTAIQKYRAPNLTKIRLAAESSNLILGIKRQKPLRFYMGAESLSDGTKNRS
jgi:hypothetical protein